MGLSDFFQDEIIAAIKEGDLRRLNQLLETDPGVLAAHPPEEQGVIRGLLSRVTGGKPRTSYLFYCVDHNQPAAIRILFNHGLLPTDSDNYQRRSIEVGQEPYPTNALSWAIQQNKLEVAYALTEGVDCLDNMERLDIGNYEQSIQAQLIRKAATSAEGATWVGHYLLQLVQKVQNQPITAKERFEYLRLLVEITAQQEKKRFQINPKPFLSVYDTISEHIQYGIKKTYLPEERAIKHSFFIELAKLRLQTMIAQHKKEQAQPPSH